jgi:16S rRNA (guanine966-N2)-methyltransferase
LGQKAALSLRLGGWLTSGALLVLEEAKESAPVDISGFERLESRSWAGTTVAFFRLQ